MERVEYPFSRVPLIFVISRLKSMNRLKQSKHLEHRVILSRNIPFQRKHNRNLQGAAVFLHVSFLQLDFSSVKYSLPAILPYIALYMRKQNQIHIQNFIKASKLQHRNFEIVTLLYTMFRTKTVLYINVCFAM